MHSYFTTIKKKKHIFCWECGMWSYLDVEFFIWWIYLTHSIISSKRFKNNNTITDLAMNNYLWWGISFNHTFEENRYWNNFEFVFFFFFIYSPENIFYIFTSLKVFFTWRFKFELQIDALFLSMQNKMLKMHVKMFELYIIHKQLHM